MTNISAWSLTLGPWLIPAVVFLGGGLCLFVRARMIEYAAARQFAKTFFQAIVAENVDLERPVTFMAVGRLSLNITRWSRTFRAMHLLHMLGHTRITRYVLYLAIKREVSGVAGNYSTVISKRIMYILRMIGAFPKASRKERHRILIRHLVFPLVQVYPEGTLL